MIMITNCIKTNGHLFDEFKAPDPIFCVMYEMKEGTKETRHWVLFVKKAFSFCVFNEKQSIHVFGLVRANACLKTKKYSVSS